MRTLAVSLVAAVATIGAEGAVGAGAMSGPASSAIKFSPTVLPDPNTSGLREFSEVVADGPSLLASLADGQTWTNSGAGWRYSPIAEPECLGVADGMTDLATTSQIDYAVPSCSTNATVYTSRDHGATWLPAAGVLPGVAGVAGDAWLITADPKQPSTLYAVSHHAASDFRTILVAKSTDGGATFVTTAVNAVEAPAVALDDGPNLYTRVLIDPRDSQHLYLFWAAATVADDVCNTTPPWENFTKMFFATSADGGVTWSDKEILDVGQNPSCQQVLGLDDHATHNDLGRRVPAAAIDPGGNLYLAYAEEFASSTASPSHLMLIRSTDQGGTFSDPIRVDPPQFNSAYAASVAAPAVDDIAIAWEAATSNSVSDPSQSWGIEYAQSRDATALRPKFQYADVADGVHAGAICGASPCYTGDTTQHLGEHWWLTVTTSGCGDAAVAYVADSASAELPIVANQVAGPRLAGACSAPRGVVAVRAAQAAGETARLAPAVSAPVSETVRSGSAASAAQTARGVTGTAPSSASAHSPAGGRGAVPWTALIVAAVAVAAAATLLAIRGGIFAGRTRFIKP